MSNTFCVRFAGAAACLLALPAIAADWNVVDTGQPYTEARFTVTEGTWMSLDVSPDGKTLVFDLLGDIYSLPARGGDATLIHGGPAVEIQPRFSPDGSKILYISDRDGGYNLWTANVDGSDARQVSHETTNMLSTSAWSPEGRYAATVKFYPRSGKNIEIWLYHLDGGRGQRLVDATPDGRPIHEPQFSHDGRYLYYTEGVAPPRYAFTNALQPSFAIKRRQLSDGRIEEVVSGFGGATTGQLSRDDKRLAFIRRVKDKTVLFVYDLQSGRQRPVYDGLERDQQNNWNPRGGSYYPQFGWFPDGRHVAIWSKGRLYRIDVDSQEREEIPFRATAEHRITVPPRFEYPLAPERFTVRAIQQIAWAPDGRAVAFNALGHLWQKAVPDGKPERLTQAARFEFEPSYSGDGSQLAYISWDDERGAALELMTVKGRKARTLLKDVGIIRQPSFSPDGKRLVYWLERGDKKMGGWRARGGVYWMSIADRVPHYVASDGHHPQFSPDGRRIYYATMSRGFFGILSTANVLESVTLDGLDKRTHVVSSEMSDLRLSRDLNWLTYKKDLQYYLIPYRETGTPLQLTKAGEEVPIVKLTEQGGYNITWSADSRRLSWTLGQTVFSATLAERMPLTVKPTIGQTVLNLEVAADKPQGSVAFVNGRIITMRGEEVLERGSVVVQGNRIVAVGPAGQVEIPKAAKVFDVAGKTVMPGLVDMHGHLDYTEDELLMPQKHPGHYAAMAFGVTTNFDPAGTAIPSYASSEMNLAGVTVGPRLISTGEIIHGVETHLDFFHPIGSFQDARNIIASRRALGTIIVKSYMQPMRSQRQQLIKAAREARVMVTPEGEGHYYNNVSMILDGHVSIEHNIPLANYYDDLIQLLARGGTSVTPTLVVTNGEVFAENYFFQTTRPWDDPKIKTYVQKTLSYYSPIGSVVDAPPYARGMISLHQADELWDIGFRSVARSLKKVDEAGGVVTVGAHGQVEGMSMHWEMWAFGEGGMSPQRILRAATVNGAKTIGLEKQIGTLEAGKLADLIVLDANPLEDIRNTNTVRYTMVNGRLYDSLGMNEIGNYDRPRTKFYWELQAYQGIDWNESWGGPGIRSQ